MDGGPATSGAVAHIVTNLLRDEIRVDGQDGHHLARVRRLRPGARATATDGAGKWREYEVTTVAGSGLELHATGPVHTTARDQPQITVAFALTKGSKPEVAVRQLTELGVDRIVPVVAARSIARPVGARAESFTRRMRRVAREATMQSRRARLPFVGGPVPLLDLAGRAGLVVAELGAPTADRLADPGPEGWTLLVGPEGGFDPEERDALGPVGRLGLGAHVLRAETAAVAGAAVLVALRQSRGGENDGHGAWDRSGE
ncbi:MAG TPA: RsmE family RNA methyltransferase [Acidimicrobiia bacterium]|nr:RsmE family RNA methyltransferase [Acidimicrobiia bacterium]